ncbi:redoxin domain-containing protein [Microbacterium sp. EYE_512]|uniref:Redoxin domain-containing protein n=2 Tax=Microbacteriaceae TaxID=85023 RepID=A0ABX5SUW2_9MICO|nr:redoxin domain-containing protein [Microbacterium sp. EYE_512]QBR89978.1 redoxin domain-containing protein [Microbacterium wangchenii]
MQEATMSTRASAPPPEQAPPPDQGPARLPSFERGTGWLGSGPLSPATLQGRVVLVDFWTFTCVNWLRTFPYLRAWEEKYRDAGLTVVGVHTPEFDFEHDPGNVAAECRRLGVEYPVLLDARYGVWEEFANHYWPAVYVADATGRIRYHRFGEGEYAATEMVIQRLLTDAGGEIGADLVEVAPQGLEVAADWRTLRSPETYLGFDRSTGFVSEGVASFGRTGRFEIPDRLPLNAWGLDGDWTVSAEWVRLDGRAGRLAMRFGARDVNLVMRAGGDGPIPFRVLLDGRAPGEDAGTDLGPDGRGELARPGTYQLIRRADTRGDGLFEIEFSAPSAYGYCVTFG